MGWGTPSWVRVRLRLHGLQHIQVVPHCTQGAQHTGMTAGETPRIRHSIYSGWSLRESIPYTPAYREFLASLSGNNMIDRGR